jgi:ParB family transcriptional regulator, chromosome partitioning protein
MSNRERSCNAIYKHIPIEYLKQGKYQPRLDFNKDDLQTLADSINNIGILEPILVRPIAAPFFEIIAGERRWRAAQLVQLSEVPCLVRNYDDEAAARIALIENTHREDLNPIAISQAIQRIIDDFDYSHEEMAAALGRPRTVISNLLRLLRLDDRVQELLKNGNLTEAHGKILAALPVNVQYQLAIEAYKKNWSTRNLEKVVKNFMIGKSLKIIKKDYQLTKIENQLSDKIGHPVALKFKQNKSGSISITFHNLDSLDSILTKLGYEEDS